VILDTQTRSSGVARTRIRYGQLEATVCREGDADRFRAATCIAPSVRFSLHTNQLLASRTREMLPNASHHSTRGMVDIHFMEIRDGKWVNVSLGGCRWIVIA
jgi:hypothetical protein